MRKLLLVVGPVLLAYAVGWLYPVVRETYEWREEAYGPYVANVVMPPGTRTDVMSSVSLVLFVIGVGLLAATPIELSKLWSRSMRRPATAYLLLWLYQVVLFLDIVRAYATDWWVYVWAALRVRPIHSLTWMEPPFISGSRNLWISGVALILVVVGLIALEKGPHSPRNVTTQPAAPA